MQKSTMIFSLASVLLIFFLTSTSMSEVLFIDNFEDDAIGKPATKWSIGHDGKDDSKVIQDPKRKKGIDDHCLGESIVCQHHSSIEIHDESYYIHRVKTKRISFLAWLQ